MSQASNFAIIFRRVGDIAIEGKTNFGHWKLPYYDKLATGINGSKFRPLNTWNIGKNILLTLIVRSHQ